ncbi:MAG TPA: sn-glycerol-3-phosphate ABC transporter ATP-binding protein UgpC [Gammaproteobacteria bacterium]|nr:sn-glycerol-3-phosphate ABC transporter ATP-binding protein UgpC [Gammaproteobacteria bacterium]
MASVSVEGVVKTYGDEPIIHGIDVEVPDESFTVLVGPSGCGKSTLLRMVAGLEDISDGRISIGDQVVNEVPARHRDVAMVFQSYALYPHMTVADNLGFHLRLQGVPKGERRQRAAKVAELVGIGEFLDRLPRQLSGGQRQRVAMARAIMRDPQVFLFDEPLSNLDAKLRVRMRAEIRLLQQRLSSTAIYVTHDQVEAMTMADQIVVMREGHVEQIGTPLNVYDRPATEFVAGFIGSPAMNLLPGRVTRGDGGERVVDSEAGRLPLPSGAGIEEGREVVYGVRPVALSVSDDARAIPATVDVVEPMGDQDQVYFHASEVSLCAVSHERIALRRGDGVGLMPDLAMIHLFDRESGRRID